MMLFGPLPVLRLGVAAHFSSTMRIPTPLLDEEVGTQQEVTCPAKVWVTQGLKPVLWAY